MHARPRSISALILTLLGVVVTALLMAGSGSASAAQPRQADSQTCVKPQPRNDDTIHIQGCLLDQREKPAAAVPDVKIAVEDSAGKVVGNGTSDATGVFDIALPGTSIDNLGNTFTVKIDKASLPKGAALRNPKQVSLKVTPKLDCRHLRDLPDRQRQRRRDRDRDPGTAARGRRPGLRAAAGDGGARPVDDLRHDGPDQLRAR